MITIEINSVDRTDDIEQETLRYENRLSKEPAIFTFSMKGDKTLPTLGQSIDVEVDSELFFHGTIVEKRARVASGLVLGHTFTCKDGLHDFDRRLVSKAYSDTDIGAVVTDIVTNFAEGFTVDVPGDTPAVETVRFNYEQPSRCLEKLANQIGWDWWLTPDDVVHFQPPATLTAPYVVGDNDGKTIFKSLSFDSNILELKNVVYVRGGEYLDPIIEADAVDRYEADGEQVAFPLVYRYNDVQVTVDGVAQTVGIDFIDDPADFDVLYNFQEKLVKFPEASKPSAAEVVRVFGNAYVPLIVQAEDSASVAAYGAYEGLEIDRTLDSIEEAETVANAVLERWREGSLEGSFKTYDTGFRVGQSLTISSALFGVSDTYKVNKVTGKTGGHDRFMFEIDFIKSGQTTFTDIIIGLIGREKDNITISPDEVIQRFRVIAEEFGLTDEIVSVTTTSGPYKYSPSDNDGTWDFSTWG